MKALVTGGAGFIGSHVVDALVARGDEVHIVDDLSTGRLANVEPALERGAELYGEDVTDAAALADLAAAIGPDVVFHLAAHIDARRSVDEPAYDATVNVAGTAAVLEAARRAGAGRLVLASTAAVYGRPDRLPTPESGRVAPLSPYGASKAAAESYLALYDRLHGLSTLALRMANVYGPRQDAHGEAGVVAIFSGAAADGRSAVVFGDGRQTRDFVHVGDVAAAFAAAARAACRGVLNVGSGRETSVIELARGLGVEVELSPPRPGDIERSCLDASAARAALGWTPQIELTRGLRDLRAPAPVA